MKAERAEQPEVIQTAIMGNKVKVWLRENIEQVTKEEGETAYQYDEYTLELRDRENLEQYIETNFDALMLKAKQAEKRALMLHFEQLLDSLIDAVAKAKGYGRKYKGIEIPPSVACEGYASFENEYQAEAVAFGQWKASLWPVCFQIQTDIESGQRAIPTDDEFLAEMPEMVWP